MASEDEIEKSIYFERNGKESINKRPGDMPEGNVMSKDGFLNSFEKFLKETNTLSMNFISPSEDSLKTCSKFFNPEPTNSSPNIMFSSDDENNRLTTRSSIDFAKVDELFEEYNENSDLNVGSEFNSQDCSNIKAQPRPYERLSKSNSGVERSLKLKEDLESDSSFTSGEEGFGNNNREDGVPRKLAKVFDPPKLKNNERDIFCWRCHKFVQNPLDCISCSRVLHITCSEIKTESVDEYFCSECESTKAKTKIHRNLLCRLLKFVLKRVRKSCELSSNFEDPVDLLEYPDYKDFIVKPMCLSSLEKNLDINLYSSCEAFLSDFKYMVHNSYIFNSASSKLTYVSRAMLRVAMNECDELTYCSDCYNHANTLDSKNYFIEPCSDPHLLVWAKFSNFPFWPGKLIKIDSNEALIKFFGDHRKALVSLDFCFLFSRSMPSRTKLSQGLKISIKEVSCHFRKLEAQSIKFFYAPPRTEIDPLRLPYLKSLMFRPSIEELSSNDDCRTKIEFHRASDKEGLKIKSKMIPISHSLFDPYDSPFKDPETDPLATEPVSKPVDSLNDSTKVQSGTAMDSSKHLTFNPKRLLQTNKTGIRLEKLVNRASADGPTTIFKNVRPSERHEASLNIKGSGAKPNEKFTLSSGPNKLKQSVQKTVSASGKQLAVSGPSRSYSFFSAEKKRILSPSHGDTLPRGSTNKAANTEKISSSYRVIRLQKNVGADRAIPIYHFGQNQVRNIPPKKSADVVTVKKLGLGKLASLQSPQESKLETNTSGQVVQNPASSEKFPSPLSDVLSSSLSDYNEDESNSERNELTDQFENTQANVGKLEGSAGSKDKERPGITLGDDVLRNFIEVDESSEGEDSQGCDSSGDSSCESRKDHSSEENISLKTLRKKKRKIKRNDKTMIHTLRRYIWCHRCLIGISYSDIYCCGGVYYCSEYCQDKDWSTHQKVCTQRDISFDNYILRLNPEHREKLLEFEEFLKTVGFDEFKRLLKIVRKRKREEQKCDSKTETDPA